MEQYKDFKKKMRSLNITNENYYLIPNMYPVKESDIPISEPEQLEILKQRGVKTKEFLTINVQNENELNDIFDSAKDDFDFFSLEQKKSVLINLRSFDFGGFRKELQEFYVLYNNGEAHPMHIEDFKRLIKMNFICEFPEDGNISEKFLDDLIIEYMNKKGLYEAFTSYVEKSLGESSQLESKETTNILAKNKEIDKNELGRYFKPEFKGYGHHYNHLDTFIEHLQTPRTVKEYAQIALMSYDGTKMNNNKPKSFARWYRTFCCIINCDFGKDYNNMNKLRKDTQDNLKALFCYLE